VPSFILLKTMGLMSFSIVLAGLALQHLLKILSAFDLLFIKPSQIFDKPGHQGIRVLSYNEKL